MVSAAILAFLAALSITSCQCFVSNRENSPRFARPSGTTLSVTIEGDDGPNICGLTDAELKRIASRVPEVLSYDATGARACLSAIGNRLSLGERELKKKIVLRLPQVLGYDYENEVGPGLEALAGGLGLADEELRSLVLGCPQILGLDYGREVEPKILAIRDELGSDLGAIKDKILRSPAVLGLPVRGGVSPKKV
mmetsp:Transcript_23971/g.47645  ORF Transcript_23971/g.47645 Transcript_23971/m.47645 type:complete len:195 (-) Transcript_23971:134-718(-)